MFGTLSALSLAVIALSSYQSNELTKAQDAVEAILQSSPVVVVQQIRPAPPTNQTTPAVALPASPVSVQRPNPEI